MRCCPKSKKNTALIASIAGAVAVILIGAAQTNSQGEPESQPPPSYVLGYTMNTIAGREQELEEFKGDVVLIVNVASKCGLTPQYEGLQALYEEKQEEGFVILGFPANNFGKQEPGTNEQIAEFCAAQFGVSFPMFEKISVKGDDTHPLYIQLTEQPDPIGGEPEWNFTKFLIDRNGDVVARFGPRTKPDDEQLVAAIDELLEEEIEEDN